VQRQKPRLAELIKPHKAGRLVNQIRKLAEDVGELASVKRSSDPTDDFLLAISETGKADCLVTGDKSGLLALGRHKATRIVSASDFAALVASAKKGTRMNENENAVVVTPVHTCRQLFRDSIQRSVAENSSEPFKAFARRLSQKNSLRCRESHFIESLRSISFALSMARLAKILYTSEINTMGLALHSSLKLAIEDLACPRTDFGVDHSAVS
jgi:hypothetical protein